MVSINDMVNQNRIESNQRRMQRVEVCVEESQVKSCIYLQMTALAVPA